MSEGRGGGQEGGGEAGGQGQEGGGEAGGQGQEGGGEAGGGRGREGGREGRLIKHTALLVFYGILQSSGRTLRPSLFESKKNTFVS